jgi:hypothetical protein
MRYKNLTLWNQSPVNNATLEVLLLVVIHVRPGPLLPSQPETLKELMLVQWPQCSIQKQGAP